MNLLTQSCITNNDAEMPDFAFVQIKAFGDLTITASSLRGLPNDIQKRCSLIIGPHLSELAKVLAPDCTVEVLPLAEIGVPPVFDMKRCGLIAGVRSALSLRQNLSNAAIGSVLVIPRATFRERFVVGKRRAEALPTADNIYLAHEHFIRMHLGNTAPNDTALKARRAIEPRIALCPFSRVAAKNIPNKILLDIAANSMNAGFKVELLLLEGERIDIDSSRIAVRTIPRRFDVLADALTSYAGVISADSLPAHLAEYVGTPAFIVTQSPNLYWLPFRAFKGQHWGQINELPELITRMSIFLDRLSQEMHNNKQPN